ncbi:carbonic anhydrase 6 isoform X2 [Pongo pygmaeus]|uniref:carbonic anhydrase 6 isoform X2 n=1 Tax=Pongo pygmaeus TaxID=9600 RepID=UPI0023E0CB93|nr:carbonic anhydrase 6 isoform X2 [Pongo pygmaeus]
MCSTMRALVLLLSLFLLGGQAQHGSDWTYSEGALDEVHWPQHYPACGGQRQSPINLQRTKVRYNPALKGLNLTGYETQAGEFPMVNNGHTVQISLPSTMRMTAADGTVYIAQQMHFHWGGASSEISGSEHTVDGIRHVIEVKNYPENPYYSNFISHLANIKYPGQTTTLTGLDTQDMLPRNLQHYYSYHGSLTTPPCTENVHWFLLADFVKLSRTQVWKLENSLLDHRNKTIHNDYRRTQPLNHRVVESNFPSQENTYIPSGKGHGASREKPKSKSTAHLNTPPLGSGQLRSLSSNTVKMHKGNALGTWRAF